MELIDLPELYVNYPRPADCIKDLVPNSNIDMINSFILGLPHDSMVIRDINIILKLNSIVVCQIWPSIETGNIIVHPTYISIYIPEETLVKIKNLGHLVKLPYDYFCYLYNEDRFLIENALRRITENANS